MGETVKTALAVGLSAIVMLAAAAWATVLPSLGLLWALGVLR